MSNAHPWLDQIPWTTKPLPRDMLEHRIQRALTLTNLGMLGTLGLKGPIVSPLEFYADKFTIYICLLYTSPSPRDLSTSRMPSSA